MRERERGREWEGERKGAEGRRESREGKREGGMWREERGRGARGGVCLSP